MIFLVKLFFLLVLVAAATVTLYIFKQGDAVLCFNTRARTSARRDSTSDTRLDFSVEVPYANTGRQEGTILDAYMRIYLPQEQYAGLLLRGKVNVKSALRDDDYFEALLVQAGSSDTLVLRFEAYAQNGLKIAEALTEVPDVDVALFADCRGRGKLFTVKKIFTLNAAEMRALIKEG